MFRASLTSCAVMSAGDFLCQKVQSRKQQPTCVSSLQAILVRKHKLA